MTMKATPTIDRAAILREAWGLARQLSSSTGKPVRSHIAYAIHRTSADASRLARTLATAAPDSIAGRVVRIQVASDAAALVAAVTDACQGTGVRLVYVDGSWTLHDGDREAWCAPTELKYARRYVAAFVDNILHLEAERAARAAAMVPQPVQLQQANAGAIEPGIEGEHEYEGPSRVEVLKAECTRLIDRIRELRSKKHELRRLWIECRDERVAAVAGEILGACPGVCWTNEERAEAGYREACARLQDELREFWATGEDLRTEEWEELRLRARQPVAAS